MVSQSTPRIEVRERADDWGHFQVYTNLADHITLQAVGVTLSMQALVVWIEINTQGQLLFDEALSGCDLTNPFCNFLLETIDKAKEDSVEVAS